MYKEETEKNSVIVTRSSRRRKIAHDQKIRQKAFELYMKRNGSEGSELDDWLKAEEEINRIEEERYSLDF